MIVFGEIFLESYKILLLFSPGVTCMSTYSISTTLGAMRQVSLPFAVCSLVITSCVHMRRSLIDQINTVDHLFIATERYHRLSKHVFNEVFQKIDRYFSVFSSQVYGA